MEAKEKYKLFYTEKEISKRFNVSIVTLCNLRKQGKIDFLKIGGSVRYPRHVYDGIMKSEKLNTPNL
jgi:hypothetical protein